MNKTLKIALIVIGSLVGVVILVGGGFLIGRFVQRSNLSGQQVGNAQQYPYGLFGGMGPGMMGRGFGKWIAPEGRGYNNQFGPGMMPRGGGRRGFGGMMGRGFADGAVTPLTVDETKTAVESYLTTLNNDDLQLKEIMVFNNNAYARIVEKSTGTGAMELLVDPATKSVFPEMGPNMMWNLKYNLMGRGHMMGGDPSQYGKPTTDNPAANTVTADQALKAAQAYLDQYSQGDKVGDTADPFYGYYTIDILRDGKPVGMLSVNGFSSQVFPHTWHGTFVDEKDF